MRDVPGFLSPASKIARRDRPIRVFGIDLGTTNSSIAKITWDQSRGSRLAVRCLDIPQGTDDDSGPLVPSIVFQDGDRAVVGWAAKRLAARMGEFGCLAERDIFAETKNDMGLLRGYPEALPGFRTPPQIASHILRFLHESALDRDRTPAGAIAISVPASFQTAQRKDTLAAAELAGLKVFEGTLLDEPTAAFLDWVATHGETS
jgi:molecular chaperone DnaK (HSP70)